MSLGEFFHMGGYAFYVWTSYAIAFVVLAANLIGPWLRARGLRRELRGRLKRMEQQ